MTAELVRSGLILVAGGRGFIGAHIARKFLQSGHSVAIIDSELFLPSPVYREIQDEPSLVLDEKMDARSSQDLQDRLERFPKPVAVINVVGPARPSYYLRHPRKTAEILFSATNSLLKCARKSGAQYIHASSSEIYGHLDEREFRESDCGSVDPLGPRAAYAEIKRACETLVASFHREFGVRAAIARLFNVYGPGFSEDDDRVIPAFLNALARQQKPTIFGSGNQRRSFCHVDDVAAAFQLMTSTDREFLCVNVGAREPIPIQALAIDMARAFGSKLTPRFAAERADEIQFRCPNIDLAGKELGWTPKIDFKSGLLSLVETFRMACRLPQRHRGERYEPSRGGHFLSFNSAKFG